MTPRPLTALGLSRRRALERCPRPAPLPLDGGRALPTYGPLRTAELYGYQVEGATWLRERLLQNKGALLADEMGVGKSAQVLRALPTQASAIVLCPASVRVVWRDQAARWRPDLRLTMIAPGEKIRPPGRRELVVGSYESLPDAPLGSTRALFLHANLRDVVLVCDEAQLLKEPDALRTQRLRLLMRQVWATWGVSGTPLLGRPTDLKGVLQSLGLFAEVFPGGPAAFLAQYQGWAPPKGAPKHIRTRWGDPLPNTPELLRRVMLRRLRKDVLPDLPTKRSVDLPVDVPADLTPYLDSVSDAWEAWRAEADPTEAGELPPFEVLATARAALARSRIPAASAWVWQALDETEGSFLVFSAHVDPIEAIGRLPGVVTITGSSSDDEREEAVRAFQAGDKNARCLAATIATGGLGLTLTRADRILFVDRDYTPANNAQAEDRAARIGSTHRSIEIVRMVSDHVLDRHLQSLLDAKQSLIQGSLGG